MALLVKSATSLPLQQAAPMMGPPAFPAFSMLPMVHAPAAPAPHVLEVVKTAFQTIPNSLGRHLSDGEIQDMHDEFRMRAAHVQSPTAADHRTTGLARTILMAPGGLAYALMDRVDHGDLLINKGTYKGVYHGVGLHDGARYAIGVCDLADTVRRAWAKGDKGTAAYAKEFLQREFFFANETRGIPGVIEIPLAFEENGKFYFVMKLYEGGDLFDFAWALIDREKTVSLEDRVTLCRKILQGVAGVHKRNIIHRDIKPENILLDGETNPALCDFGLATTKDDRSHLGIKQNAGSAEYLAPEIHGRRVFTPKADVWAAGIVLYSLLCLAKLPWQFDGAVSKEEMIRHIPTSKSWTPPFPGAFSMQDGPLKELLRGMLQVDPAQRLSSDQALALITAIERALKPHLAAHGSLAAIQEDGKEEEVFAAPRVQAHLPPPGPQSSHLASPLASPLSPPGAADAEPQLLGLGVDAIDLADESMPIANENDEMFDLGLVAEMPFPRTVGHGDEEVFDLTHI